MPRPIEQYGPAFQRVRCYYYCCYHHYCCCCCCYYGTAGFIDNRRVVASTARQRLQHRRHRHRNRHRNRYRNRKPSKPVNPVKPANGLHHPACPHTTNVHLEQNIHPARPTLGLLWLENWNGCPGVFPDLCIGARLTGSAREARSCSSRTRRKVPPRIHSP